MDPTENQARNIAPQITDSVRHQNMLPLNSPVPDNLFHQKQKANTQNISRQQQSKVDILKTPQANQLPIDNEIPNGLIQPLNKPPRQAQPSLGASTHPVQSNIARSDRNLINNPLREKFGPAVTGSNPNKHLNHDELKKNNSSPIFQLPSNRTRPQTIFAAGHSPRSDLKGGTKANQVSSTSSPVGENSLNVSGKTERNQDDIVQPPGETVGPTSYLLASQPKLGGHWKHESPKTDARVDIVPHSQHDFSPDPVNPLMPYDAWEQIDVYQGKTLYANQRPLLEIGRPWYQLGQLAPGKTWFGATNLATPQLIVFGDARTAVANIRENGSDQSIWAFQANIDIDLKLTATERFHAFMSPLTRGADNTRFEYDNGQHFISEFNPDLLFGYFEGDLGAIVGGYTGQTLPFDFPFTLGVIPLVFQNGVWMEDAVLGAAFTVPARNSPALDISNMDTTFFFGFDKIDSPAFQGNDNAAKMYGVASFIESRNGYFELDYAYLEDRDALDRSYHNIGVGYTRRFGKLLSNSVRLIANAGQSTDFGPNTADGFVFLVENSLITQNPSTFVPYANFWVGVDRPQSAARAGVAGGILRNTGILFETDNLTGYPTLDPTANDTYGGAIGLNILKTDFSQQLVLEAAMVEVMGNDPNRNAAGRQLGLGARYQLPLSNAVILRADAMIGFLQNTDNISGMRLELRHKF